jgi:hypothetical protein
MSPVKEKTIFIKRVILDEIYRVWYETTFFNSASRENDKFDVDVSNTSV